MIPTTNRDAVITVRGYHLDLYGHVNNARYLEFLEEGRWAAFEGLLDVEEWGHRGLSFVVVNININYRAAATLGQALVVTTRLRRFGQRSATLQQRVLRRDDAVEVVDAEVTFVIVDAATGRAAPMEGELRQEIERVLEGATRSEAEEAADRAGTARSRSD